MNIAREVQMLFEENRRTTGEYQYTLPSKEHYPYQWLWDSCFHAIILARSDPESARAELCSLLSKQFKDGMVPHIIYWEPGILHLFRWGVEGTSSLTQPPIIAYAAWEVHRRNPDQAFLESVYPALLAYYRFLVEKRDPRQARGRKHGLQLRCGVVHAQFLLGQGRTLQYGDGRKSPRARTHRFFPQARRR